MRFCTAHRGGARSAFDPLDDRGSARRLARGRRGSVLTKPPPKPAAKRPRGRPPKSRIDPSTATLPIDLPVASRAPEAAAAAAMCQRRSCCAISHPPKSRRSMRAIGASPPSGRQSSSGARAARTRPWTRNAGTCDLQVHQRLPGLRSGEPISDPARHLSRRPAELAARSVLPHSAVQAVQQDRDLGAARTLTRPDHVRGLPLRTL